MKKIIFLSLLLLANFSFAQDYTNSIKSYLKQYQTKSGLLDKDVAEFSISSQSYSKSLKAHTVYVEQHYKGVKIFNSVSPFLINEGSVVSAQMSFVENLSAKANTSSPSISAAAAIGKAANKLGIEAPSELILLETKKYNSYVFSKGNISQENIPVQLVYEKTNDNKNLSLAWDLSIYLRDGSHYYSIRIDAITGEILTVDDLILNCAIGDAHSNISTESILFPINKKGPAHFQTTLATPSYRVFPIPYIGPQETVDRLITDPSDALASPFGWHDTNGVVGPEYTTTRGNNVLAQEDHNGTNGTGQQAEGGPNLIFDFPYNLPRDPYEFTSGAITNLFYMNNIMHDVFYHYGFDEASGNFQSNNYNRGGTANDMVIADAQDGSGTNNANFATGPDGVPPRMQMYLWSPPGAVLGKFLTINNGLLSGSYYTNTAQFGPAVPTTPITANLALVNDDGTSGDPHDACDPLTNGSGLAGKIAVIRRGSCNFIDKVEKAQNAGAIAVVMVDNAFGDPIIMGGEGPTITIPSVMIYQTDGEAIISELLTGSTISATLVDDGSALDQDERDGDLDNVIVAHEYGHGISNRLTGGRFVVTCLNNEEQMGEGWSDYFGLMLTMKEGETGEMARGIGTYALGQGKGGLGLRAKPYSTDLSVNSFNYNNIKTQPAPHGVGSVWATMLWDMTWNFIDEYGFDPDIYQGQGGNNMALQLVMDGLKLQRCRPGFVDGRNAILQADEAAHGGANKCLIWRAFARRGLGFSASQGSPESKTDGTQAFDLPEGCTMGIGEVDGSSNFSIYPNPAHGEIHIQSKYAVDNAKVHIYDMNGRKVLDISVNINPEKTIDINGLNPGIYLIKIEGEGYSHTSKLIVN